MSSETRFFDVTRITIAWLALDFDEGLVSLSVAFDNDLNITKPKGKAPGMIISKQPNQPGTITMEINQTSGLNQDLEFIANQGLATSPLVKTMSIVDSNNGAKRTFRDTVLNVRPGFSVDVDAPVVSWAFRFGDYKFRKGTKSDLAADLPVFEI